MGYAVVMGLLCSSMACTLLTDDSDTSDGGQLDPITEQRLGEFDTRNLIIDRASLRPGGPGKDGVPALVDPATVPVGQAQYLPARSRIISVTIAGQTRGYPIAILNWHEIVNDTLGGISIAVVYCPLCDSVSVVDRRIGGKTLVFGVSGLLYNSNVVMYDRVDQALWSQGLMKALSGPHAGDSLRHLPFELLEAGDFQAKHPGATVLSDQTGHHRDYTDNPYAGYLVSNKVMFDVGQVDRRLPPKTRVIGVVAGGLVRAYPLPEVQKMPGGWLAERYGGGVLTLHVQQDAFERTIQIVELPDGANAIHTFWFAWAAMHPQTEVWIEGIYEPAGPDNLPVGPIKDPPGGCCGQTE